ncbi:hypothetical protein AUP68_00812 [Ilyonectria robusta]
MESLDSTGRTDETKKSYGSNYFGKWIYDDFGNPAFQYTCDQRRDQKAETPVNKGLLDPTEHIHQVGNDRLVVIASNHGYVQVRQDEGGPKFLNCVSPERAQFGGGIGYLTDGTETLSTFYGQNTEPRNFERVFGMGYYQKKVTGQRLSVDQVIHTPFGDDPVVLSQVTIRNLSREDIPSVRWVEYWGCHQYQFSFRLYMLAQAHKTSVADLRHQFGDRFKNSFSQIDDQDTGLINNKSYLGDSAEESAVWEALKPVLAANPTMFAGGAVSDPADHRVAFDDLCPPKTFLASLDAPADAVSAHGETFFGSGGPENPSGLQAGLVTDVSDAGPSSAMLLQRNFSLGVGESRTLFFLYGYNMCETDAPVRALVDKYSQEGAQYVYVMGNNSSSRDPLQHALPLVYSDPQICKEVLRYTLKMVRPDGSIPYGMVGHGMPMPTIMDDASDIPLFLLWLASEYVLATRDAAFLDEVMSTYPLYAGSQSKASVLHLLQAVYECMHNKIGTGTHGLFRQLQDDWNDAVVTIWVPEANRSECVRDGESVPNSAMAAYTFDNYAQMLQYVDRNSKAASLAALQQLADTATRQADIHREATRRTWTGKWFKRAWLGSKTGWIGERNIWLEPQPWAMISGAADDEMTTTLVESIDTLLRQPSTLGAMQQNGSGEAMANNRKRSPGMSVNGGLWPALNVLLVWALARKGFDSMAWDEWKRNSLARHAEVYPDVWYGTWSSLDSINSSFNERPGRASFSETFNQEDFPVTNSHCHASQLTGIPKLLGVQFTATGLTLRPPPALPAYSFESALLGSSRDSKECRGWYAPAVGGEWEVVIQLTEAMKLSMVWVEINGKEEATRWTEAGDLLIIGRSSASAPLSWKIGFEQSRI